MKGVSLNMKGNNFKKTLKLFDYFKHAYRLNIANKQIYKPQIIYILLKTLFIILTAFSYFSIIKNMHLLTGIALDRFIILLWNEFQGLPLILTCITIMLLLLGTTYVEAGLYHMYYKCSINELEDDDWRFGARRYFLRFLGSNIIVALFWIIAAIPFLLIGIITLSIGFSIIPIIVSVFFLALKVAIVRDNISLFSALNASITFGKNHFIPLSIFIFIRNTISFPQFNHSNILSNSNSFSSLNDDSVNSLFTPDPYTNLPLEGFYNPFENLDFFKIFSIFYAVVVSVISVSTIIIGLINMIFNVFFGIVITLIYKDNWLIEDETTIDETITETEVL